MATKISKSKVAQAPKVTKPLTLKEKVARLLEPLDMDDAEFVPALIRDLMAAFDAELAEAKVALEKAQADLKKKPKVVTKSKSGSGSGSGEKKPPTAHNDISSVVSYVGKEKPGYKSLANIIVLVTPTFGAKADKSKEKYANYAQLIPAGKKLKLGEIIKITRDNSGSDNHMVNSCLVSAMMSTETKKAISAAYRKIVPLPGSDVDPVIPDDDADDEQEPADAEEDDDAEDDDQ